MSDKLKKTKSELFDELNKINKEYEKQIGELSAKKLKLNRLNEDNTTDDEIYNLAKASIDSKYKTLSDKEKDNFESKKSSLTQSIEKALSDAEKSKQDIDKNFEQSQKNLEDESLKRGVQRSSIVIGEMGELEKAKNESKSEIAEQANLNVESLNKEIEELSDKLSKSLADYDMQAAVNLNEKIQELQKQRTENQQNILKCNNSVSQAEANFNKGIVKEENDEALKKMQMDLNKSKLSTVLDFYLDYDNPSEAFEDFLNEEELRSYLGDYYEYAYNTLSVRR